MSEDEVVFMIASAAAAAFGWSAWYRPFFTVSRLGARTRARTVLMLTPLLCLLLLFVVLRTGASFDVRGSVIYLVLYMIAGAGWLGLSVHAIPWFGVSPRIDAVERDNDAAATACAGALLGVTLCFAGGNIGDGPGWWVVLFSALLATSALYKTWWLLERWGETAEQITIERDHAAGVRLASFLVAAGLILGRAVAGDWHSFERTLFDFVLGAWPVIVLLAVAVTVERRLRVTVQRPSSDTVSGGVVPGLLYLALSVTYVLLTGRIV